MFLALTITLLAVNGYLTIHYIPEHTWNYYVVVGFYILLVIVIIFTCQKRIDLWKRKYKIKDKLWEK